MHTSGFGDVSVPEQCHIGIRRHDCINAGQDSYGLCNLYSITTNQEAIGLIDYLEQRAAIVRKSIHWQ